MFTVGLPGFFVHTKLRLREAPQEPAADFPGKPHLLEEGPHLLEEGVSKTFSKFSKCVLLLLLLLLLQGPSSPRVRVDVFFLWILGFETRTSILEKLNSV